jgi:phage protein U
MLAALGMFIFDTDSALFDELSRRRSWRHGRTERFGARAASQFLGPGQDQVTLSGKLIPELAGSYSSIEKLVEMADTGEAYPLADGLGNILGSFTIETIDEQHSNLIDTGRARTIDFSIDLERVD